MKYYKLFIDAPFKGGQVVIFSDNELVFQSILSPEERHSISLFRVFREIEKKGILSKIGEIFFNVGPGNFSSLRVIGGAAFGLSSGLKLEPEKLRGFSYLDLLVWEKQIFDKEMLRVAIEDNRDNWVGSTYVRKNDKFTLFESYWRRSKNDKDIRPDIILKKTGIFSPQKLIIYLNSEKYLYRNPWNLLYYQKSYFE